MIKRKKIDLNFWKNKKVLITGHTGFKGSWLSMILKYLDCKIYGYALIPDNSKSIFKEYKLSNIFKKSIISDVRNFKNLYKKIELIKPDIIIHMAAQPLVIDSYKKPHHTFDVNFMGTLNLLECIKRLKIKRSLIITTDKVYKNINSQNYFKESDELGGNDPYSASKASVEILVNSFAKSFFISNKNIHVATARAGNVVGGGDWSEKRLIPDFFTCLFNNKVLSVRNPSHTRPWQHVLEPLVGYILLIQSMPFRSKKLNENISWNFGPANKLNLSVKKILEILSKQNTNKKVKINFSKKNPTYKENKSLSINTKKTRKFLNFQLKMNINSTLQLCTEWYNAYNQSKKSSSLVIQDQIQKYLKKYYL
jgi:CDP-glucose 4,6-dehydratase